MKKIAYIEIDTHAEIAGNFRELMNRSKNVSVDYYFSEKILNLLGETSDNKQIFKANSENLFSLLKDKKYDLVIIGTAHRYFSLFLKVVECFPTLIIAHNLNFIKASIWEILRNIVKKDFKFRLKLLLREGLLLKNKVYKRAKSLVVLDKEIASEEYVFLPLFYNKFFYSERKKDDVFRIVIPGAVSQKRRDYRVIISKIGKIEESREVEVVFLGKASGEELRWIKKLEAEKIGNRNLSLVYFTEKVSQNIFDEWMKKADVLWCPIQQKTEFFSVEEYYGITKISGNIGDAIKYGKRAVFPEFYQDKYPFILSENQMEEEKIGEEFMEIFKNYEKNKISVELEKIFLNS